MVGFSSPSKYGCRLSFFLSVLLLRMMDVPCPAPPRQLDYFPNIQTTLWTMSYELQGPVYAFMSALTIGRIAGLRYRTLDSQHPGKGSPTIAMLITFAWCLSPPVFDKYSYFSCFFGGVLIAWLDVSLPKSKFRANLRQQFAINDQQSAWRQPNYYIRHLLPVSAFIFAMYCAVFPLFGPEGAWWADPLTAFVRHLYGRSDDILKRFWYNVGNLLFMWSILELDRLKRWLANKWAVFLGKLSFMIYLLHCPLVSL